jgi:hypothetical protein
LAHWHVTAHGEVLAPALLQFWVQERQDRRKEELDAHRRESEDVHSKLRFAVGDEPLDIEHTSLQSW